MGEKMTLTEVRDWLREAAKHDGSETTRRWYGVMADAIDAHLTKPAQAAQVEEARSDLTGGIGLARFHAQFDDGDDE